ncbi:MAG TPA: amidase family protein [Candidatus Acidoferrales bacterium]|nr:amidase family protein [Candidatus Acidoferrales bacterium]
MKNKFDPDFGSALDAAAAIRARQISSAELTEHTLRRIDAFQPQLNAYVYQLREEALESARKADEAIARAGALGALHGVPINVKESFGVQGRPCTWGVPALANSKAPRHAVAVRRLLDAGAILLGATNVPLHLMDCQSFNDIYGTSNNPWDLTRTPGGSSGGSAASLAAGMAFFSVGSDIGGSIRTPAAFCGIYGHKPTLDIVNMAGHAPGGLYASPGFSTLLSVGGPMARSAEDLEAGLRILAGLEAPDAKALQWTLPKARHQSLREFRVGYVLEDPAVPVSSEIKTVLESVIRACERAGAKVKPGWPDASRFRELLDTYLFLLGAFDFSIRPPEIQQQTRDRLAARSDAFAKGAISDFAAWQRRNLKRLAFRAVWEEYFNSVDVFLLPTAFTTAIPHDYTPPDARVIPTPEGDTRAFVDMVTYISPATLTGCPATTAPAGLSRSGLPVGLQIVGPYLEDATPIAFSQLLAREIGGFQPPGGYGSLS